MKSIEEMKHPSDVFQHELGCDPFGSQKGYHDTYIALQEAVNKLDSDSNHRINELRKALGSGKLANKFGDASVMELLLKAAMWIRETGLSDDEIHAMVEEYRLKKRQRHLEELRKIGLENYHVGELIG